MPLVEWKPEFTVGFERFDGEHRDLISLLNQLHTALVNQQQNSILDAILKDLDWYTRWHFKAEEVLMKSYAYPDRFREQVAQYSAHFESGRDLLATEVSDALQEWLIKHILLCDAQYVSFFQTNGIADIKLPQHASV
jgi:hemerythrin